MATLVTSSYANIVNYNYAEPTLVASDFIVEGLRTTYTTVTSIPSTYANTVGYSYTQQTSLTTDTREGLISNVAPTLAVGPRIYTEKSANINATQIISTLSTATDVLGGSNARVGFSSAVMPDLSFYAREYGPPIPFIEPKPTFAVSTNGAPFVANTVGPQFWNLG